jgi:hypothetical protein
MYRVNAELSQEKNEQSGRMQRCTKVTCATRAQKKTPAWQLTLLFSTSFASSSRVGFKRMFRFDARVMARRES